MAQHKISNTGKMAVYAEAFGFRGAMDVHASVKNRDVVVSEQRMEIRANMGTADFQQTEFANWLPFAAREYQISADIKDYVLVPVITMPSDLPNRNGVGFPLKELTRFNVDQGRMAYKTFAGKPVHVEHDNQDPTKAAGVIVDAAMRKMEGYGGGKTWKLLELLAIDRSKNPVYASAVLNGEINSYSMGAWVESYSCGYCNATMGACTHINKNRARDFYVLNGRLVFRQVHGIVGFETSIVRDPAFVSAISDHLMGF